jgi:hypothetical protein
VRGVCQAVDDVGVIRYLTSIFAVNRISHRVRISSVRPGRARDRGSCNRGRSEALRPVASNVVVVRALSFNRKPAPAQPKGSDFIGVAFRFVFRDELPSPQNSRTCKHVYEWSTRGSGQRHWAAQIVTANRAVHKC